MSCHRDREILAIIDSWEHRDPVLTHLKMIDIRTPEVVDGPLYSTRAFVRALNLERIHLRHGVLLKVPLFSHLTDFYGTFSSVLQLHKLLESVPSLQDISILYKPSPHMPDIFPPTPLTHPNIRKVTVCASAACFSSVIFPSLEELVIDSRMYESNFEPKHVNHLSSIMGNSNDT
ncbi:hypothetical protein IW261DRAFT_1566585 [Armillaria novae-zelandiae]|uniref:Uncharacterized protein n=1 Tax=Armillaria novae-zelandiae TaxID=153914 RepID=A0AA39P4Q2_9AGAR|nr:hypothetical protein IW261DRAFT_1566585 [Armillaria novae-zelandiae]